MSRFKEIAHDDMRDEPRWRLYCDNRRRYRLIVEIDENFSRRDISHLESSLSGALHDLYRSLNHKFVPDE